MGHAISRQSAAAIERCACHREQLERLLDALDGEAAALAALAVPDIHSRIEEVRRREAALAGRAPGLRRVTGVHPHDLAGGRR